MSLAEIKTAIRDLTPGELAELAAYFREQDNLDLGSHARADAVASVADRYATYIGAAADLPSDLAANLDLYIHGHGRK
jgi:hypothetical protein